MVAESTGYDKEWLAEKRVLSYRFHDLSPTIIDRWADDLAAELNAWPNGKTWRLMLDIRLHGGFISPYSLRRAREIASLRPDVPGRLAVLVSSKLAADIITMTIRATNNTFRKRSVFNNEPIALRWLLDDKAR
ncbi:MAG: hypothetical protein JNJ61_24440 [Anaerolineae bacterium]|nr:hypothetical protein [Anaerolineae bacterium]